MAAGGNLQTSGKKPRLSFWQIWNMSFGFLGIQFGFGLQNANVSRIFETLGADIDQIPILWIAAPLTGLIVQPIVGYFSDKTWTRLGRRRPYFLVGAILASIALILMPNSPTLWIAAGMLWIMDASINISMEPFRAFVGDNLSSEQRTMGFAMQSFFIGIGAVVASMLPYIFTNWLGISNEAAEGMIPPSVKWSFYFGGIIFLVAVLWTVFRSKEYSPKELAAFEDNKESETFVPDIKTPEAVAKNGKRQLVLGGVFLGIGSLLLWWLSNVGLDKQLYILAGLIIAGGLMLLIAGFMQRDGHTNSDFAKIINDFQYMPKTMRQLALVQFFSWFALFSMWIYTTNAVTRHTYDMNISQAEINLLETAIDELTFDEIRNVKEREEAETKKKKRLEELRGLKRIGVEKSFMPVNLANYLLDDKIHRENDWILLVNDNLNRLQKGNAMNEAIEKEVAEKAKKIATSQKVPPLSFEATDYFLAHGGTAFIPETQLANCKTVHSLKRIQKEYNNGGDWVGVCFAVYNGIAAIIAFLLPLLARWTSRKMTHLICLVAGGIGLISIFFISSPNLLLVSMIGIGIAWASILSMPYAILTGALPASKMGYYMGIFNFFIVIPQLVAAALLGFLLTQFF